MIPFSFDYGLYQLFLALLAGAAVAIEPLSTNPFRIPALLKAKRISGFPLVPALAAALLRSRLLERIEGLALRYLTSTGELLPTSHVVRLAECLPGAAILPMYGLTECKRVAMTPIGRLRPGPGSVGVPISGSRVLLRPLADDADVGELLVRGPNLMDGYWRDEAATRRRFRIDPQSGERTLHSGDIFRRHADGGLSFLGRIGAFPLIEDQPWFPAPLEDALADVAGISEVAITFAAAAGGEAGFAVHVAGSVSEAGRRRLRRLVEDSFAGDPPLWLLCEHRSLPRTSNGKIDRTRLAADPGAA